MSNKKWLIILGFLPVLVILAGMFKFNFLSNLNGYDIDGNKIKQEKGYYEKIDEKKIREKQKMIVKIPTWEFNEKAGDFVTTFKEYSVPYSKAVLKASLEKLFSLRGGDPNNAWNGLKFDSVKLNNGVAEIYLRGNWYPAGDMSGAYFGAEINETAFQFSTVEEVKVFINGEVFDWCMDSEAEPEESGCDKEKKLWIKKR